MESSPNGFLPFETIDIDEPSLLPCLREINETAESKAKCLEILREELRDLQDIEPCLEEAFLLPFLRVSKFDTSKAFQRILKHYKHQEKLLDTFRKSSLSLQKARKINYVWFSPYRMKNNSCLIFAKGGVIDYSKVTFVERLRMDVLQLQGLLENPVNQIAGGTIIFDYSGFNFRSFIAHTPHWAMLFVETMSLAPGRIKAIHLVNCPSLFLAVFKMVFPFVPKKIQERVFVHSNDGWKSLHTKIEPEILPEMYGGKLKFDSCINANKNLEELDNKFCKMAKYGYIKTKTSRQSLSLISR